MTKALQNAPLATLLFMLFLGGCASSNVPSSRIQAVSLDPVVRPLRMVLVETPNSVEPAALRNVLAPDFPEGSGEANKLVESGVAEAEMVAMAEMRNALTTVGIKVVSSVTIARNVNESGEQQFAKELSIEQSKQIQLDSGADDLLRFHITDYGLTPRAWRNWVIGFEVVTTVGIAAIAYSVPETRPLAGVYLVTEAVEEGAEAYAGFWALNKLNRPVRIEAELFDLHTGKRVWADSNTGLAKVRLTRLAATIDASTRNALLKEATHESVEKLVGQLGHSLSGMDMSGGSAGSK